MQVREANVSTHRGVDILVYVYVKTNGTSSCSAANTAERNPTITKRLNSSFHQLIISIMADKGSAFASRGRLRRQSVPPPLPFRDPISIDESEGKDLLSFAVKDAVWHAFGAVYIEGECKRRWYFILSIVSSHRNPTHGRVYRSLDYKF